MKKLAVGGIVILLLGGYTLWASMRTSVPATSDSTQTPTNAGTIPTPAPAPSGTADEDPGLGDASSPAPAPMSATVVYDGRTFSPSTVTISKGGTVTFLNKGTGAMWVASDLHPAHQGYANTTRSEHCPDTLGVAFDQCGIGNSYTFTFAKSGSWNYHNHTNSALVGTVVVQ